MYTLYKKKNRKQLLIQLLSNIGLAYIFEYIVLNIYKAYRYKPKVFRNKYLDNVFGAILSQAIIVPFTSLFITAFQLGWKTKISFGLYFAIVERIFIKIGCFHNRWWRTSFTATLIPLYFYINDIWYRLIRKENSVALMVTLYNCLLITRVNVLYVLSVMGKVRFGFRYKESWREHFIIAPLYAFILAVFTTRAFKQAGYWPKIRVILFSLGLDWALKRLNILKVYFKSTYKRLILHTIFIFSTIQYKKLIQDAVTKPYNNR